MASRFSGMKLAQKFTWFCFVDKRKNQEDSVAIACISLTWESFSTSAINLFSYECKRALEIISFRSLLLFLMDSRMNRLLCIAFLHTNLRLNPAEYSAQLKAKSLLKQRQGEQWGRLSCK